MKPDFIICHYGEVALKGGKRPFFEKALVDNIRRVLDKSDYQSIKRISGRILIALRSEADEKRVEERLKKVFGLEYFSFAFSSTREMRELKIKVAQALKGKQFNSFSVRAKRGDKQFPLTSQAVNQALGQHILETTGKEVKLENPDITCFVEIVEDCILFYFEKIPGLSGLPADSNGRVVSLLSGGIDSPVASFYMISRGLTVVYLHCYTDIQERTTVKKATAMVKQLKDYQKENRLYLIPFLKIQEEIFKKTNVKLACLLCRRSMLKIAAAVAGEERADGIVTGENIGQVASQTLPNIRASAAAVSLPVFKPLLAFDKKDIIEKSREIGLFEISVLKDNFYCRQLISKHPETNADLEIIEKEEEKIDFQKLITDALAHGEVKII